MSKTTLAWIGVGVIVVIVAAVAYSMMTGASLPNGAAGNNGTAGAVAPGTVASSATMTALPAGGSHIAVPGQNATSVPAGVAAPTIVGAGSPQGTTSFRSFNITETAHAFTPNTIIVNQGDTVHINLTAQGGTYDFTQPDMGLKLVVPAGETKVVQFDANTPGKLTFYCSSCGGPSKGPVGYIEVVSK
jgi:heme/copper-type cytochrome/quinol oxidase subunit 2